MLNTANLLDEILVYLTDNSADMRAKCLTWLNIAMKRLALDRDWQFLRKQASITFTGGSATAPADFSRVVTINNGVWFLDRSDLLSTNRAFGCDSTSGYPCGYTVSSSVISLKPATDGAATLEYIQTIPDATDSATDTVFAEECRSFFVRSVLASAYEFDYDMRAGDALLVASAELRRLKHWDNNQTPQIQVEDARLPKVFING